MVIESYSQINFGTKYPRRKKKRRRNELDPKDKGKTGYQDHYGL
jgi:hypothetical protein